MNSRKRRRESVSSSESEDDEQKRTLFVANLHPNTTEEILYELFLQAGPIESIRIPKDKDTKKQKTFGFVEYKYTCAAPYALELYDGVKLFGQRLTIRQQIPNKDQRPSFNANSNRDSFDSRNSLRHGFGNNRLPNTNFGSRNNNESTNIDSVALNPNQFLPQLVNFIRDSFDNPYQSSGSRHLEKPRDSYKNSSRNDSRHNNRDKPYQKPNYNDRHKKYSHRDNKRSDQRRNR